MKQAIEKLRDLIDEIDEMTRLPGEPPLRETVAKQARERLAEMNAPKKAPTEEPAS